MHSRQGLIEWFLSNEGKTVAGYRRAVFSGITTQTLSELIARLLRQFPSLAGVWHVAAEPINKFDLLRLVRDAFRVQIDIRPDDELSCDRSLCGADFVKPRDGRPRRGPR